MGAEFVTTCYVCGEDLLEGVKPFKPVQVVGCNGCLNISQICWEGEHPRAQTIPGVETLGNLAPRGSVMAGVLEMVPKAITSLPVLAEIPQRVVSTIHDPISSIADVVDIIEEDAVLSTKILSLANSAYFVTPNEINDLNTACSRLGMRALANMANTMASANQYRATNLTARKLLQRLWQHAIVTAHCADALAQKLDLHTSTTFFAGLLHDIGKVVMVDVITAQYEGATGRLKDSPDVLARAIEPFASLVGLHVAQHWKLSPELSFATLYAEHPEDIPNEECRPQVYCVQLASDIAESKGYGIGNADAIDFANHSALEALGLGQDELEEFVLGLEGMLDSVLGVLGSLD